MVQRQQRVVDDNLPKPQPCEVPVSAQRRRKMAMNKVAQTKKVAKLRQPAYPPRRLVFGMPVPIAAVKQHEV